MFCCQKFRAHGCPAASEAGIRSGKINEARLGIPQNETRAVIIEALWEIEAQLLQLIECWPRAELAQHKHRRHIQRTSERFA